MKTQCELLVPHMSQYRDFDDRGETRYLPYLMYFHRTDYRSAVINTDRLGFRVARGAEGSGSVATAPARGRVRLVAGSSAALGVGATSDATTVPSRLWTRYAPSTPWLNFGGRSHSSMQELILLLSYRHLLPEVDEIVILSGFNDLATSRLPKWQVGDNGAYFFCGDFFEAMERLRRRDRGRGRRRRERRGERVSPHTAAAARDPAEIVATALDLTSRHLEGYRSLAGPATRISYVLQPLAPWIRDEPAPQERLLFDELDGMSRQGTFTEMFGQIATREVWSLYSEGLRVACEKQDVSFVDLNSLLAEEAPKDSWIFVDRAHCTDAGYDLISRIIARQLNLS
ncbi:Inducer of phenazine A [Actinomadura graeca]|uniref:Inducer of phenazine A n=2 Tax=Actinomadura graeca TaxID=2750812 RepID=A0ABX8R9C5_9ACTN|nr:Inducer of phenazine A [Actinomadura graeca]